MMGLRQAASLQSFTRGDTHRVPFRHPRETLMPWAGVPAAASKRGALSLAKVLHALQACHVTQESASGSQASTVTIVSARVSDACVHEL